jgi:hypothetical protein
MHNCPEMYSLLKYEKRMRFLLLILPLSGVLIIAIMLIYQYFNRGNLGNIDFIE